jgi:hypothetical protein
MSSDGSAGAGAATSFSLVRREPISEAMVLWWLAPPSPSSSGMPKRSRWTSSAAPCARLCLPVSTWGCATAALGTAQPSPAQPPPTHSSTFKVRREPHLASGVVHNRCCRYAYECDSQHRCACPVSPRHACPLCAAAPCHTAQERLFSTRVEKVNNFSSTIMAISHEMFRI